jgi:hypothetical protein
MTFSPFHISLKPELTSTSAYLLRARNQGSAQSNLYFEGRGNNRIHRECLTFSSCLPHLLKVFISPSKLFQVAGKYNPSVKYMRLPTAGCHLHDSTPAPSDSDPSQTSPGRPPSHRASQLRAKQTASSPPCLATSTICAIRDSK